jgi:hypothetical protein
LVQTGAASLSRAELSISQSFYGRPGTALASVPFIANTAVLTDTRISIRRFSA